jgi:hypothetical protein
MGNHSHTFPHSDTLQGESPSLPEDPSRHRFIQGTIASTAVLGNLGGASLAYAQTALQRSTISHYHVPATDQTVHWGYFSKSLKPLVEVESGDFVTIETGRIMTAYFLAISSAAYHGGMLRQLTAW